MPNDAAAARLLLSPVAVRTVVEVTSKVSVFITVAVAVSVCVTSDATSHVSVSVSVATQLVFAVTGCTTVRVVVTGEEDEEGSGGGPENGRELVGSGGTVELASVRVVVVVDDSLVCVCGFIMVTVELGRG